MLGNRSMTHPMKYSFLLSLCLYWCHCSRCVSVILFIFWHRLSTFHLRLKKEPEFFKGYLATKAENERTIRAYITSSWSIWYSAPKHTQLTFQYIIIRILIFIPRMCCCLLYWPAFDFHFALQSVDDDAKSEKRVHKKCKADSDRKRTPWINGISIEFTCCLVQQDQWAPFDSFVCHRHNFNAHIGFSQKR